MNNDVASKLIGYELETQCTEKRIMSSINTVIDFYENYASQKESERYGFNASGEGFIGCHSMQRTKLNELQHSVECVP